jgi:hypothetical protein
MKNSPSAVKRPAGFFRSRLRRVGSLGSLGGSGSQVVKIVTLVVASQLRGTHDVDGATGPADRRRQAASSGQFEPEVLAKRRGRAGERGKRGKRQACVGFVE